MCLRRLALLFTCLIITLLLHGSQILSQILDRYSSIIKLKHCSVVYYYTTCSHYMLQMLTVKNPVE